MRLISVNGETAVHHVDERPWKCTIRLLSGNRRTWITQGKKQQVDSLFSSRRTER